MHFTIHLHASILCWLIASEIHTCYSNSWKIRLKVNVHALSNSIFFLYTHFVADAALNEYAAELFITFHFVAHKIIKCRMLLAIERIPVEKCKFDINFLFHFPRRSILYRINLILNHIFHYLLRLSSFFIASSAL
jgi:hypothetical protein